MRCRQGWLRRRRYSPTATSSPTRPSAPAPTQSPGTRWWFAGPGEHTGRFAWDLWLRSHPGSHRWWVWAACPERRGGSRSCPARSAVPSLGNPPITRQARAVFRLAQREAFRLKYDVIGSEHILLGFIRAPGEEAANVLGGLGIDLEEIRSQLVPDTVRDARILAHAGSMSARSGAARARPSTVPGPADQRSAGCSALRAAGRRSRSARPATGTGR